MHSALRILVLSLSAKAIGWSCSCVSSGDACQWANRSDAVVFVGRVTVDSGTGLGNRPARVEVEEGLANVPPEAHALDVATGEFTSCYRRLRLGERYVIFGQKLPDGALSLYAGGCSPTFAVAGNEGLLDAIRGQFAKGQPRLLGQVKEMTARYHAQGGIAGATVVARGSARSFESTTDEEGRYELSNLPPGSYTLEVFKEGFSQDYNFAALGGGPVELGPHGCASRELAMWPEGQISGAVRDNRQQPVPGLRVEVFQVAPDGGRDQFPLRSPRTDANGRYLARPLPPGKYVVAVNINNADQQFPYAPVSLPPVEVAMQATTDDVDIQLAEPRKQLKLRVLVLDSCGQPARQASVSLLDSAGKLYATVSELQDSVAELPAVLGGQYIVKATGPDGDSSIRIRVDDEATANSVRIRLPPIFRR